MTVLVATLAFAGLVVAPATAQSLRDAGDGLAARQIDSDMLRTSNDPVLLEDGLSFANEGVDARWQQFAGAQSVVWTSYVDRRTGSIDYAEGGNIAWIPGAGNSLRDADLGLAAGAPIGLGYLEALARGQVAELADALGVDPATLVLNSGRSGQRGDHVWFVDFDVLLGGRPIEGARVVFYVNNGNLVAFGTENLPSRGTQAPVVRINRDRARQIFFAHADGFQVGDTIIDNGTYRIFPVSRSSSRFGEGYAPGNGRGVVGVWEFVFRRDGMPGTWRGRVDATSGELLTFHDMFDYGSAT
ncbi:MAG: hypothetical protein AB7G12_01435, partial [Thermoanaerobaculia bacterium]